MGFIYKLFPTTLQLVTKVLGKSPIFGHMLNGYKYHNWGLGYTFIDDLKNVVIVKLTRRLECTTFFIINIIAIR